MYICCIVRVLLFSSRLVIELLFPMMLILVLLLEEIMCELSGVGWIAHFLMKNFHRMNCVAVVFLKALGIVFLHYLINRNLVVSSGIDVNVVVVCFAFL